MAQPRDFLICALCTVMVLSSGCDIKLRSINNAYVNYEFIFNNVQWTKSQNIYHIGSVNISNPTDKIRSVYRSAGFDKAKNSTFYICIQDSTAEVAANGYWDYRRGVKDGGYYVADYRLDIPAGETRSYSISLDLRYAPEDFISNSKDSQFIAEIFLAGFGASPNATSCNTSNAFKPIGRSLGVITISKGN